ncbi:MAG TPA: hypothetical protein VK530_06495 [Candidatus Acidoferrum sp.]|nr:hypothetical protein [Candidatus Acidoferrum sp.]
MRRSKLRNGILVALTVLAIVAVVVTVRLFDLSVVRQADDQPDAEPSMAAPAVTTMPQPVANTNPPSFTAWRQQLGTVPMTWRSTFRSNLTFTATNYARTQQIVLSPIAGFLCARRN